MTGGPLEYLDEIVVQVFAVSGRAYFEADTAAAVSVRIPAPHFGEHAFVVRG
jgi:hypothetical protein